MNTKTAILAGMLALPVAGAVCAQATDDGHGHGERSPAVEAALREVIAQLPQANHGAMRPTRQKAMGPGGPTETVSVDLDKAIGMSVVVVLDENGVPHSECVETAGAPVIAGSASEPRK